MMGTNIRIAGQAGQGVKSAGALLVNALARRGLHVLATRSYMSRIRGGLNWYDIRIADSRIYAGRDQADILVALNDEALEVLGPELSAGGIVVSNGPPSDGRVGIEMETVAQEIGGAKVMANTVAAGAVYAICGYRVDQLCEYLSETFAQKGEDLVSRNVACACKGAELAAAAGASLAAPRGNCAVLSVMDGASVVALSACRAGLKFATAYPMTPATSTFTWLAANATEYGLVVEQAEDELAAVNMICGASYAGAVSMTATSGGGFALMTEALSLAGMMELPIVILLAQRPGPATGMPTRTAQQDLLMAIHAGHGEFPRAIYAPGTCRQCYSTTRLAIATAHKYQSPVIILTDQYLQDMETNYDPPEEAGPVDRHIQADPGDGYERYKVTPSGVSPRAVPGGRAKVVCDSDEHTADGHITEDIDAHMTQQDKRLRKAKGLAAESLPPEMYPRQADQAETLLMAWGSTYGPCREAVDLINKSGGSAAMLHFGQVWPLNVWKARKAIAGSKRVVSVEANQTGQFASLLHQQGLDDKIELVTRYDGLPFTAGYILDALEQSRE